MISLKNAQATSAQPTPSISKKEQILELYRAGITDVADLAMMTDARHSYVGAVLREAGLDDHYFDLYTSTRYEQNAYSKLFVGKLHFKDLAAATESVDYLELIYRQFERTRDRAGQHHVMVMAMTMANRARWSGKHQEAQRFQHWLIERMIELEPPAQDQVQA